MLTRFLSCIKLVFQGWLTWFAIGSNAREGKSKWETPSVLA